jgi:hypothetical protein
MIPRIMFSIKSKFFATARVKRERGEKRDGDSDVNGVHHHSSQSSAAAMNATMPQHFSFG